jgi:hypothetical protein
MEQTDQIFYTRCKEHIQAVRNKNSSSGYSNHILNTGHAYGSITDNENHTNRKEKRKTNELEKIPRT